jgi:hypothetical protein
MKLNTHFKAIILLSMVSPIFFGCQPREDGKTTRIRPDMRRKVILKTLNDADRALPASSKTTGAGKLKTEEELPANQNPLEMPDSRCRLFLSESDNEAETEFLATENNLVEARDNSKKIKAELNLCDAIFVQPSEDGTFQVTSTDNLENANSGVDVKDTDIKRYSKKNNQETTLDPKGTFFSVDIISKKGQNVIDGRDILQLSYILPWKKQDMDMKQLIVNLNGRDLALQLDKNDKVADVLVSEWSEQVIVRIKNYQLIKNINFKIQIRGEVTETAVLVKPIVPEKLTPAQIRRNKLVTKKMTSGQSALGKK